MLFVTVPAEFKKNTLFSTTNPPNEFLARYFTLTVKPPSLVFETGDHSMNSSEPGSFKFALSHDLTCETDPSHALFSTTSCEDEVLGECEEEKRKKK
jgi:hypothetical protein